MMLFKNVHFNAIEDCISLCNLTKQILLQPPEEEELIKKIAETARK